MALSRLVAVRGILRTNLDDAAKAAGKDRFRRWGSVTDISEELISRRS
jgi:hypothetical protein